MLWMGQRNPINHQFGMGCFNPKNGMLTTGWSVFNWWFGFRWLHRRSSKWNKIVKNWCFWVTIFLWCKVTQEKRGDDVEWVKHQETWIKLGMWWQKFRRDEMWGCEKPPIRGVVERLKKTAPVCSRSWWLFGPMRLQGVYSDTVIPQCPQQRHGGNFAVCILGLAGDLAIMLYHVLPCFTPMFIVNLLVKWRNHRKPSTGWIWLRKSWFRIKIALNWGYTPFIKSHQPSLN